MKNKFLLQNSNEYKRIKAVALKLNIIPYSIFNNTFFLVHYLLL